MTGRIDHFGVNVSDLDAAVAFYRDRLGFEEGRRFAASSAQDDLLGLDRVEAEIAFLEAGGGTLELKAYASPPGENVNDDGAPHDVGMAHLCLAVDDLDAWYDRLAEDVEFLSPPRAVDSGARIANLRDPDGNVVELIERP